MKDKSETKVNEGHALRSEVLTVVSFFQSLTNVWYDLCQYFSPEAVKKKPLPPPRKFPPSTTDIQQNAAQASSAQPAVEEDIGQMPSDTSSNWLLKSMLQTIERIEWNGQCIYRLPNGKVITEVKAIKLAREGYYRFNDGATWKDILKQREVRFPIYKSYNAIKKEIKDGIVSLGSHQDHSEQKQSKYMLYFFALREVRREIRNLERADKYRLENR